MEGKGKMQLSMFYTSAQFKELNFGQIDLTAHLAEKPPLPGGDLEFGRMSR